MNTYTQNFNFFTYQAPRDFMVRHKERVNYFLYKVLFVVDSKSTFIERVPQACFLRLCIEKFPKVPKM